MKTQKFLLSYVVITGWLLLCAVGCKKESPEAAAPDSAAVQLQHQLNDINRQQINNAINKAAQAAAVQATPSFPAEVLVKQLLQAIKDNDYGTIYKMDYDAQNQAASIRQTTPQFLVEKKLQENYDYYKSLFDGKIKYWSLAPYARLNPDTKIVEVRDNNTGYLRSISVYEPAHEVYVSLKFKSGAMPDQNGGKLKETVFKLVFSGSGLYMDDSFSYVNDADVVIPVDSKEASVVVANPSETKPVAVSAALQETLTKAQTGDVQAQLNAGVAYSRNKNYDEAFKWNRKAAEQGNATAQTRVGIAYESGRGVAQDYTEAINWYRKAAEQGNAMAEYNLGVVYQNGTGVDKNNTEAVKWFQKSSDQGNSLAKNALQRINNGQ